MKKEEIIIKCKELLEAYKAGQLGQTIMPEETHPDFNTISSEERLAYFTLPMALNYQRSSYQLWEAALKTHNDNKTKWVFDVSEAAKHEKEELKESLLLYKLAMQPNKHTETWRTICTTISKNFDSFSGLLRSSENDFLKLKNILQNEYKKGFPYLSGPKIFNYWAFVIQEYGGARLSNSEFIEIAPDTRVTQCSVMLGVINEEDAKKQPKEKISQKWRELLKGSGITPIEMHPPLWFWSKNNFQYKLKS